ncbi:MAG: shikimate dehydrogenase [Vicinamibacterales bacterium]
MTASKLCIVIQADSMADLRRQRDAATDADLVELRLDGVADLDVAGALDGRARPAIVTCRPTWEGGRFDGSEDERRGILARALALGAEYVDVEWRAGFADLLQPPSLPRIVLSSHDFERMPDDLIERAQAMQRTGAGTIKIAAQATRLADIAALQAASRALDARTSRVLIAMGPRGEFTRVCAARLGSAWTYAGTLAGIGQIGPDRLIQQYGFRGITAATRVFGIVGLPVSHSVSPAMHNAAFRAAGLDAVYLALPAVDADDFLAFAEAVGLAGASVTIPYKVALAARADVVDPLGRRVKAINTLRCTEGRWEARNTDVGGFLRPLTERGTRLEGARAAVLGAGGSARAVIAGLQQARAQVRLHARDRQKAAALAAEWGIEVGAWPPDAGSWDLLVNCTPVGMYPDADLSPLPAGDLPAGGLVYDLIYNPMETRLLREARTAGCTTIGGLEMLVGQAQEQFEWWTGRRPDAYVMRTAALARLAEFRSS